MRILLIVGLILSCTIGYVMPQTFELNQAREVFFHLFFYLVLASFIKDKLLKWFYVSMILIVYLNFSVVAFMTLKNVVIAFMFYMLTCEYIKKHGTAKAMAFIRWLVILNVGLAYIQLFGLDFIYRPKSNTEALMIGHVVHGFMHNPNHFAALIGIGFPLFFIGKWRYLIPVVILPLFMQNRTVCHTKGGLLLIVFCFVFYGLLWKNIKKTYWIWLCIILIIVGIVVVYGKDFTYDTGRINSWKAIVSKIPFNSLAFGHGLCSFYVNRPAGPAWHEAHNEYLQGIYEVGLIPVVIALGYIIHNLVVWFKLRRKQTANIIFGGLCCVAINSLVNFTLHQVPLLIMALIYMALWTNIKTEENYV